MLVLLLQVPSAMVKRGCGNGCVAGLRGWGPPVCPVSQKVRSSPLPFILTRPRS